MNKIEIEDQKNLETVSKEWAPLIIMLVRSHIGDEQSLLKDIEGELISLSLYSFQRALDHWKKHDARQKNTPNSD